LVFPPSLEEVKNSFFLFCSQMRSRSLFPSLQWPYADLYLFSTRQKVGRLFPPPRIKKSRVFFSLSFPPLSSRIFERADGEMGHYSSFFPGSPFSYEWAEPAHTTFFPFPPSRERMVFSLPLPFPLRGHLKMGSSFPGCHDGAGFPFFLSHRREVPSENPSVFSFFFHHRRKVQRSPGPLPPPPSMSSSGV